MSRGLYVHIPFCVSKCNYCSFNSVALRPGMAGPYLDALRAEAAIHADTAPFDTLYIGGGTPTLIEARELGGLVRLLRDTFRLPDGAEITVEANPGTLYGYDIGALVDAGVNRVSLGAQSFDGAELKLLGRAHGPDDVDTSVRSLRDAGVSNVGLDLIYAIPGQTIERLRDNVEKAVGLGPKHISLYDLTLEEGTPLWREAKAGRLSKPPEELQAGMYLMAAEMIESAGYARYEISNFAMPGYECRHNQNYWAGGEFLGLGAGAHSSVGGVRWKNSDGVDDYTGLCLSGRTAAVELERPTGEELRREFIMLSLRTGRGMDVEEYARRFGRDRAEGLTRLASGLERGGFVELSGGYVRLGLNGVLASDAVISELV